MTRNVTNATQLARYTYINRMIDKARVNAFVVGAPSVISQKFDLIAALLLGRLSFSDIGERTRPRLKDGTAGYDLTHRYGARTAEVHRHRAAAQQKKQVGCEETATKSIE